jgi:hypothetical protein
MSITVLATLGLGEHYVIDLVLSVPYAVAIWSLVERQWMRFGMLLSIVIVWLVALREGWAILLPMPVAWLLCGMTVLAALPWRQISVPSRVAAELPSDAVCLGGALSGE